MDISQYTVGEDAIQAISSHLINKFFETHQPTTQKDCDGMATDVARGPVQPTAVQGVTSYTVLAGSGDCRKVVHFRAPRAVFNVKILECARQTYGEQFVPGCEYRGMLGQLHVYLMDYVPGTAFCLAQRQLYSHREPHLLTRTVQDLARFFAAAWHSDPASMAVPDALPTCDEYSARLTHLAQALPARFHPKLAETQKQLPLLFMPGYPSVLNHGDLLEMNIHVDTETGGITGIVDWLDAKVGPFGTSLWGLETLLGVMTGSGWRFHPSHRTLREAFWDAFYAAVGDLSDIQRQAITVARMVGIFHSFGFLKGVPVQEGEPELRVPRGVYSGRWDKVVRPSRGFTYGI